MNESDNCAGKNKIYALSYASAFNVNNEKAPGNG
jgi:hypothetical protein